MAIKLLVGIVITVMLFHLCILFKIVPYGMTWGGRLTNATEMYVFEGISIILNFVLGIALLIKGNYLKQMMPLKMVHVILWVFLILFALNTVGNLFAKSNFEKILSLVTLVSALLLWIILNAKKRTADNG